MKKRNLFQRVHCLLIGCIALFSFFQSVTAYCQSKDVVIQVGNRAVINEKKEISLDTIGRLRSLLLSGEVTFLERNGYFQVILLDSKGKEYLVYREAGTFYVPGEKIILNEDAYETAFLDTPYPNKLIISAKGCSFNKGKVHVVLPLQSLQRGYQNQPSLAQLKQQSETYKQVIRRKEIDRINHYNEEHKILWVAGETSFSRLPYEQRKNAFSTNGDDDLSTYGWEYYSGGILTPWGVDYDSLIFYETTTTPYVESFSWSNRHGKDWNTKPRNQMDPLVGGCWAHGPLSAFEAYVNLYRGEKVDQKLSIQELLSCSDTHIIFNEFGLGGYGTSGATDYIVNTGLMSEDDFPLNANLFTAPNKSEGAVKAYCNSKPSIPQIRYKAGRKINVPAHNGSLKNSHIDLMDAIMKYGPGSVSVNELRHVMCIVGWGVIKPGLFMEYWPPYWDPIMVSKDHPLANKVYWIIKNSCGEGWGYNGYACLVRSISRYEDFYNEDSRRPRGKIGFDECTFFAGPLKMEVNGIEQNIEKKAFDEDGDGYYRWGFGGKPDGVFELEDADDSDPTIGPMNKYGFANKLKKTDLYIRDSESDKGVEPNTLDGIGWESPDILLTTSKYGSTYENPVIYPDKSKPLYVKVTVHNKGEASSSNRAMLYVSWTVPTVFSNPFIGIKCKQSQLNLLDSVPIRELKPRLSGIVCKNMAIPAIKPGKSATVTIEWFPTDSLVDLLDEKIEVSLMAEIICIDDAYYNTNNTRGSNRYILDNNNVAKKSLSIAKLYPSPNPRDPIIPGIDCDDTTDGGSGSKDPCIHIARTMPLFIQTDDNGDYRLKVYQVDKDKPLIDEAEVRIVGDKEFRSAVAKCAKIKGATYEMSTGVLRVLEKSSTIEGIKLPGNIFSSLQLQVNFLTKKVTDDKEYIYRVVLENENTNEVVDGYTYIIRKPERNNKVEAITEIVNYDGKAKIVAKDIGESAQYRWKDLNGNLLAEGKEIKKGELEQNGVITLEVTATKDGFKDIASVVVPNEIKADVPRFIVSPSPASDYINVNYSPGFDGTMKITVTSVSGLTHTYQLQEGADSLDIDILPLPEGTYGIALYKGDQKVAETTFQKKVQ